MHTRVKRIGSLWRAWRATVEDPRRLEKSNYDRTHDVREHAGDRGCAPWHQDWKVLLVADAETLREGQARICCILHIL